MAFTKKAITRIINATKAVESSNIGGGIGGGVGRGSIPYDYICITKDRINKGASGVVYVTKTSSKAPVQDTSIELTVANPIMGDILPGIIVPVAQWIVHKNTDHVPWSIGPFYLLYEGKVKTGISAESTGVVTIWKDGSPLSEDISDVHWKWITSGNSLPLNRKVRIVWDFIRQRFVIESMECS